MPLVFKVIHPLCTKMSVYYETFHVSLHRFKKIPIKQRKCQLYLYHAVQRPLSLSTTEVDLPLSASVVGGHSSFLSLPS